MRIIADLHVHSKYARGTSPQCDIKGLAEGAKVKGIGIMATGDFTHPAYFNEIKSLLGAKGAGTGDNGNGDANTGGAETGLFHYAGIQFILSTEVCVIFEQNSKTRKMHHVLLAPSLDVAGQINDRLAKYGDLQSDGRPILKLSSAGLVEELHAISPKIAVIPAHAWTPWFSIFGSKSGVDSVEEAFEDQAHRIFALETGLSSDPEMNWTISKLDRYSLVSNSDAHSLGKLGREANVFELNERLTYDVLIDAIKTRKGFAKTYEFYPEEGKYHYDGHRDCKVLFSPGETENHQGVCPVCRKKVTVGVMHRVYDLADRRQGLMPKGAVPFQRIVPLVTVISKALKKPEASVVVAEEYDKLIRYFGNEFAVFEASEEQIRLGATPELANAIMRVKQGRIKWVPGYDGVFGELLLEDDAPMAKQSKTVDKKQKSLADF